MHWPMRLRRTPREFKSTQKLKSKQSDIIANMDLITAQAISVKLASLGRVRSLSLSSRSSILVCILSFSFAFPLAFPFASSFAFSFVFSNSLGQLVCAPLAQLSNSFGRKIGRGYAVSRQDVFIGALRFGMPCVDTNNVPLTLTVSFRFRFFTGDVLLGEHQND